MSTSQQCLFTSQNNAKLRPYPHEKTHQLYKSAQEIKVDQQFSQQKIKYAPLEETSTPVLKAILKKTNAKILINPDLVPVRKTFCDDKAFRKNQIDLYSQAEENLNKGLQLVALAKKYAFQGDLNNAAFFYQEADRVFSLPAHCNHRVALLERAYIQRRAGNHQQANDLFFASGKNGHPGGYYELGQSFRFGWGRSENQDKYLEMLRHAAEKGYPPAQYEVGLHYKEQSKNNAADIHKALYWLQKAHDNNYAKATYELTKVYQTGLFDIPQDVNQAKELLSQIASKGNAEAQYELAMDFKHLYAKTKTEETCQDMLRLFTLAAKQGHLAANYELSTSLLCPENKKHHNFFALEVIAQAEHEGGLKTMDMQPTKKTPVYKRKIEVLENQAPFAEKSQATPSKKMKLVPTFITNRTLKPLSNASSQASKKNQPSSSPSLKAQKLTPRLQQPGAATFNVELSISEDNLPPNFDLNLTPDQWYLQKD